MLYVFHGTNSATAVTKAASLVNSLRAKKTDAAYVRVEAGNWTPSVIEEHLGSCDRCLGRIASAHDAVSQFNNGVTHSKKRGSIMKKLNLCVLLTLVTFVISFVIPRFFVQLLVATLLLGLKWVTDSKSTKMLVMIHEAWKKDGVPGASRILKTLEDEPENRVFSKTQKQQYFK